MINVLFERRKKAANARLCVHGGLRANFIARHFFLALVSGASDEVLIPPRHIARKRWGTCFQI